MAFAGQFEFEYEAELERKFGPGRPGVRRIGSGPGSVRMGDFVHPADIQFDGG